jgi:hypothetical protein
MTTTTLQQANDVLRSAVKSRLDATPADDDKLVGYSHSPTDTALPEPRRFYGSTEVLHPTSQAFCDLCDSLKEMHRRKSRDYGCPSGEDPLANIRNGAKFVGIPAWKGAMVRLSDKVTRLAAYNATGRLENESLEDNLADLASYALLALLLHREEHGGRAAD